MNQLWQIATGGGASASTAEQQRQRDIQNSSDLFRVGQEVLALAFANAPKNTRTNYEPKQKEWMAFCHKRAFTDGISVTEDKLLLFLSEEVFPRTLRKSRYTKGATKGLDERHVHRTLGISAIDNYVSALISLWSQQSALGQTKAPHPRGLKVKALLRDRARSEAVRRKTEFQDRGMGTHLEGYDQEHMLGIVRHCWTDFETAKVQHAAAVESYLRTSADFLLGHHMLLRGESRRKLELADLFALPLKNEGPTPCIAMMAILDNGKTNQFNRLEYGSVVRHKNPLLCTMSQTAFYLFQRWNISREPPPRFQRRPQWYGVKLLKGERAGLSPFSYETQLSWTNRLFKSAGFTFTKKKTHAPRIEGAIEAELAGTPDSQIRRGGRWNADAMSNCYASSLPREFVRAMAGFPPTVIGNYYLPRAKVEPPKSLVQVLWPWIDDWKAWFIESFEGYDPAISYDHITLEDIPEDREDRKDLAGQGFLRLLDYFRTIILQDSVILRREFPSHPIWRDPLFAREDYKRFAELVELSLLETAEPDEIRIRNVVPDVASRLDILRKDIVRSVDTLRATSTQQSDDILRRLDEFLAGDFSIQGKLRPVGSGENGRTTLLTLPSLPIENTPLPAPLASALPAPAQQVPPYGGSSPPIPTYRMSRTIASIRDLWREWDVGLSSGPAVRELESSYGASWRPGQTERVFFCRRKFLIDDIVRRSSKFSPPDIDAAIQELESLVIRQKLTSIHGLWLFLHGKGSG